MISALIFALVIVFSIMGVCDLIFLVRLAILSPKEKRSEYILLPLDKDDYKLQIISCLHKKKWYGNMYCDYIIALTDALNEEKTEELKSTFKSFDIIFVKETDLRKENHAEYR